MSRFLFVTWDGGGNVPPLVALGSRLVFQSHPVRVLGPRSVEDRFTAAGCAFRPFSRVPEFDRTRSLEDQRPLMLQLLFGPGAGEDLLEELEREPADSIVIDCMLFGALAAAETSGRPTAALIHFLHAAAVSGPDAFTKRWEPGLPLLEQTRSDFGLEPLPAKAPFLDEVWARQGLALVVTPHEFDEPLDRRPSNFRYVGPIFEAPCPGWAWDLPWPADDIAPLVVVGFSTTYMGQERLLVNTASAIDTLGVRGLITLGCDLAISGFEASDRIAVRHWTPHGAVLPFASAMVTHGGHSTVMAALAHGVPLVCIPMGRDQHHVARQVECCGLGRVLPADAESHEIRGAVEDVMTDPSYREAAARMAEIIAAYGNGARAVNELERLSVPVA
jgi:MGT family glycosyltransferase